MHDFELLIQAISDVVGFRFRLYTVPDNMYGVRSEETGEWSGIVRQLIDKRADLAVASMTINYARETVIDFTKPFMNLGISILFKAPKDPATEVDFLINNQQSYNSNCLGICFQLFSFMNPLEEEIWLCILLAYVLVSLTIWIVARFSPYEWLLHPGGLGHGTGGHGSGHCACAEGGSSEALRLVFHNDFTLPNAFWFAIGTLMQQG